MTITAVAGDTFLKLLVREMGDQFREHEPASMHPPLSDGAAIRSARPFLALLDFKSFPSETAAILNERKDLRNIIKYFTGH
jgi:hypothetical protein